MTTIKKTPRPRRAASALESSRDCAIAAMADLRALLLTASGETAAAQGSGVSADGVRGRLAFVSEVLSRATRLCTAAEVVTDRWQRLSRGESAA